MSASGNPDSGLSPLDPMRDVAVWLEPEAPGADGRNQRLLFEGDRIARALGGRLIVVDPGGANLDGFDALNCTIVLAFRLRDANGEMLPASAIVAAGAHVLGQLRPRVVALSDGDYAREFAPALAHALDTAAVLGVRGVEVRRHPDSRYVRPGDEIVPEIAYFKAVLGGQYDQDVTFGPGLLEIAALDLKPMVPETTEEGAEGKWHFTVREVKVDVDAPANAARRTALSPPDFRTVDIIYASRILAVGSGLDADLLPQAEELAELLNASVATTRPVVDDGLIPKDRMIGQTGKTVSPGLYVALGISGSAHHVAGFTGADKVFSVNRDVRAPIFQFSDTGYVGDLREVLPLLVQRIKEVAT